MQTEVGDNMSLYFRAANLSVLHDALSHQWQNESLENSTRELTSNHLAFAYLHQRRSRLEIAWTSVLLLIVILVTVGGNLAVVFAVYNSVRLREQVSNLFIVNLSVTDLSSGGLVMFSAFFPLVFDLRYVNSVWCNIVCAANYIFIIVSMLTLAAISVERYIAIVHTFKHNILITRGRILIVIGYSWIQGLAFALPPVALHWVHYDYWEVICAIDWQYQKQQAVYYVITACVVCFLIPGLVMCFCYLNIIRHARKVDSGVPTLGHTTSNPEDVNNPSNLQIRKASKSASKTIRSLLVVVALFFLCLTPFCVTKFIKVVFPDAKIVPGYANLTASYFQYLSSMVNPFIYAIFRQDFRNAYRLVWWRLASKFCVVERPNLDSTTQAAALPLRLNNGR